jgi:hypothetical protein
VYTQIFTIVCARIYPVGVTGRWQPLKEKTYQDVLISLSTLFNIVTGQLRRGLCSMVQAWAPPSGSGA